MSGNENAACLYSIKIIPVWMCCRDRVRTTATKLAKVQVANTGPYREAHTRYLTSYRASAEPLEEIRQKQLHTISVYFKVR